MEQMYKNSDICQKCANCCKQWWLYFHSKDDITRLSWLDTDKFIIEKVKENLWKVIFDFVKNIILLIDLSFVKVTL